MRPDDSEHWWSRSQEAEAEAASMPDPDTKRIMFDIAEKFAQIARQIEVRARRPRYAPALGDLDQPGARKSLWVVQSEQSSAADRRRSEHARAGEPHSLLES
jgi:hypothetical protein